MLAPLKNKVLVRLLRKPRVTSGGIALIAGDKEEPSRAVVKSIGEGVDEVQLEDVVMFDWNKAKHVLWVDPDTYEKEDYWLVDVTDIIWVFEDYEYTDEDILT
jgi:co-chaperonin GroES (HSP10)